MCKLSAPSPQNSMTASSISKNKKRRGHYCLAFRHIIIPEIRHYYSFVPVWEHYYCPSWQVIFPREDNYCSGIRTRVRNHRPNNHAFNESPHIICFCKRHRTKENQRTYNHNHYPFHNFLLWSL